MQSLTKLRHENLLLFMGIATESPSSRYVIVNSAPRGLSLADVRSQAVKNAKQQPERIGYAQFCFPFIIVLIIVFQLNKEMFKLTPVVVIKKTG